MGKEKLIGEIGNYYGNLSVKEKGGKFYWGIENYNGTYWEEISEDLYNALLKHDSWLEKQTTTKESEK